MLCSQVWLGDALHNHTDLELLDLHHTKIGDDDAISLAEVRAAAPPPRHPCRLRLPCRRPALLPHSTASQGLKNNDNLRRLAMHNNRITDVGAAAIAEALKTNKALTLLSLSSNAITDVGAAALGEALRVNQVLRRLDLYFNMVGDEGGVAIAEALTSSSCCRRRRPRPHSSSTPLGSSSSSTHSLTYLLLTYHYHYRHHQALTVNSALRVLHLDNNRVGDPTALALAKSLKVHL